ncbi:MAG: hypothetical protein LBU23_01465, partial [Planctomycetota bacterium]|nr:hypothetical protein [Planctomycetota bacterium]
LPGIPLRVESRRLHPIAPETPALEKLIQMEWPEARELKIADFAEISEKTSFPAFMAEFLTGQNEDTQKHLGAAVYCDAWTFWFDLRAAADSQFAETESAEEGADRLREEMRKLLLTLDSAADGNGFDPGNGVSVLEDLAGPEDGAENAVMSALIRIKREVNPEADSELPANRTAYRYDGFASISLHGLYVHRFSYGADSPEKFTAERHFGVDRQGTVYEMDIPAGGEYRVVGTAGVDSEVPNWWGEYHNRDITLAIGNYREGPAGMYFIFSFSRDGETLGEGTAAADGRSAACEWLRFTLSESDESVEVTLEGSAATKTPGTEENAWQGECVGYYTRRSDSMTLANDLGLPLKAIYGHAPGNAPWRLAGAIAEGGEAEIPNLKLRACGRLLVMVDKAAMAAPDGEIPERLQFFSPTYLEYANGMTLIGAPIRDGLFKNMPILSVELDAARLDIPAGIPFPLLRDGLECGMSETEFQKFMNPWADSAESEDPAAGDPDALAANAPPERRHAVNLAGSSWTILEPTPATPLFLADDPGKEHLASLVLSSPFAERILTGLMEDLSTGEIEPALLATLGGKAIAFNAEGAGWLEWREDGVKLKAELLAGMENATVAERRTALLDQLERLGEDIPEEAYDQLGEGEAVLRLVWTSPEVTYELIVRPWPEDGLEARLYIDTGRG